MSQIDVNRTLEIATVDVAVGGLAARMGIEAILANREPERHECQH